MSNASTAGGLEDADARELMSAAGAGDADGVASLLAAGADVNAAQEGGDTALIRAASKGHLQIVRTLIEAGADTNAERDDGFTALALAVLFGYSDIVRALLDGGADSAAVGRLGTTAEKWARFSGFDEIVEMLEDSRRTRTQQSPDGTQADSEGSGAPLLFPPEGNFSAVVPLSELGSAPQSYTVAHAPVEAVKSLTTRRASQGMQDEQEEATLVPRRAACSAPIFRPRRGRPSWSVMIAALILSVAAGLTAGTYLIKTRQPVEIQTPASLAEDMPTESVGATKPPAPEVTPVASESGLRTSPPSETDPGADAAAPVVNAETRDEKIGRGLSIPRRGPAADAPSGHGERSTEASPTRAATTAQPSERPSRKESSVKGDPHIQREASTTRRATGVGERLPVFRTTERSLPVSSPPASTKSKKVIQWP